MRTRRVRHAVSRIEMLLRADGIDEKSHLYRSWIIFKKAFIKEYKNQMFKGGDNGKKQRQRGRRINFKADPSKLRTPRTSSK